MSHAALARSLSTTTKWTAADWLAALEHLGERATPDVIEQLTLAGVHHTVTVEQLAKTWFIATPQRVYKAYFTGTWPPRTPDDGASARATRECLSDRFENRYGRTDGAK